MSSRYGGFRVGKGRILNEWDKRKSSSSSASAPASILEFDYSTAQGIWNLKSTTQFPKRAVVGVSSMTFIGSSISSAQTISLPAGSAAGDLAVLVEFSTTVSPSTPAGWTDINQASTTGMLGVCSYKVLSAQDLVSTVTGITGTTRKTILVFRPNTPINTVTLGSINGEATTATPANQSLTMSGVAPPVIGIVHYGFTNTAGARSSTGLTMTEVANTAFQFTRYVIFNSGDTPTNGTIALADSGSNALQSFYLQVS